MSKTKIIVPLLGKNENEWEQELKELQDTSFDGLEWRADYSESPYSITAGKKAISFFKTQTDKPILVTLRTQKEGGQVVFEKEKYSSFFKHMLEQSVSSIDIEWALPLEITHSLLQQAKEKNCKVILSFHDMEHTPSTEKLVAIWKDMYVRGASVGKIACMARSKEDVHQMLYALLRTKKESPHFPVVGISMGEIGKVTRLIGSLFDTPFTFVSGKNASAFGQLTVKEMEKYNSLFY